MLAAIDGGGSAKATAQLFQVSVSYIYKALGRRAATGETEARPQRNRQTLKLADHHAAIAAEVALRPDVTLDELRAWLLATHGVEASLGLMHKTLARLGLTRKKSRGGRRSRTDPTSPSGGSTGGPGKAALSPARLVFVDETGAATNMARRYGRSPRGKRLDGPVPHGHWKSTTFVGGLTSARLRRPLRPRRRHERHASSWPGSSRCWRRSCGRATS